MEIGFVIAVAIVNLRLVVLLLPLVVLVLLPLVLVMLFLVLLFLVLLLRLRVPVFLRLVFGFLLFGYRYRLCCFYFFRFGKGLLCGFVFGKGLRCFFFCRRRFGSLFPEQRWLLGFGFCSLRFFTTPGRFVFSYIVVCACFLARFFGVFGIYNGL